MLQKVVEVQKEFWGESRRLENRLLVVANLMEKKFLQLERKQVNQAGVWSAKGFWAPMFFWALGVGVCGPRKVLPLVE